jgi:hypothetical protein
MLTAPWTLHLNRGLSELSWHRPAEAVKSLQKALDRCPAARRSDLYRICFYLGIALRRVGYPQSAIKSWTSCQRLHKRGHMRKLLSRFTNCYGMDPQASSDGDDWLAFSSIQLARYLLCKNKRAFSTPAEQDMIKDLVRDAWDDLRRDGGLAGMSSCEKLSAFRAVHIVFPSVVVPEPHAGGAVIAVNFQTQRRVGLTDRCSCGSGQPFFLCCGRTPGREEILSGVF